MLILCTMLISLCGPDVLSSILLTFKLIRGGLLASLLAILLILTDHPLLVKGLFFPSGPFSKVDVSSCFAADVAFLFFLFFTYSLLCAAWRPDLPAMCPQHAALLFSLLVSQNNFSTITQPTAPVH